MGKQVILYVNILSSTPNREEYGVITEGWQVISGWMNHSPGSEVPPHVTGVGEGPGRGTWVGVSGFTR